MTRSSFKNAKSALFYLCGTFCNSKSTIELNVLLGRMAMETFSSLG